MNFTPEQIERAAIQSWALFDGISLTEAKRLLDYGKPPAKHDGDCTKQPYTCFVCFREQQLAEARLILEAAFT